MSFQKGGLLGFVAAVVVTGFLACGPVIEPVPPGVKAVGPLQKAAEQGLDRALDVWEVYYIQGSKVGYGHTTERMVQEDGQLFLESTAFNYLALKRFGQKIIQTLRLEAIELPTGDLVRFRSELSQGPVPVVTEGQLAGNRLVITTTTAGKTVVSELPWQGSSQGFFATEQSLRRNPMRPGEVRHLQVLIPIFNQAAKVTLKAGDYESTEVLGQYQELLRIESSADFSGLTPMRTVNWTNREGHTLKSFVPSIGQTSYRVSKTVALTPDVEETTFDLGDFSIVRIEGEFPLPHDTQEVVYRVRLQDEDPSRIFDTCLSQGIESMDDRTARIVVKAVDPKSPKSLDGDHAAGTSPEDLQPNSLIQSDDARVVEMAFSIRPQNQDPWHVACRLEKLVRDKMQAQDFSQAFATAAEVAETLQGDCTEHAVLLAALCRAREIPARVAMGLVYYPQERGFAYHMWNEVWMEDRWVPLDATLGRGGIGAAHLKLGDSNLHGAEAYAAFLPVFQVLGRLSIEIEQMR